MRKLFIVFIILIGSVVLGDEIHLKDGTIIEGEIKNFGETYIDVMTPDGIFLPIERSKITSIKVEETEKGHATKVINNKKLDNYSMRPQYRGHSERHGANSLFELYGGGGMSFAISPGEFRDYWDMGFNFGAGIGGREGGFQHESDSTLSFMFRFDFYSFSFNGSKYLRDYGDFGLSISGGRLSAFGITGNFKNIVPKSIVSPYLTAGMGYFHLSISDIMIYDAYGNFIEILGWSENTLCIILGTGITFGASTGVFIEVDYVIELTEALFAGTQFLPIRFGVCKRTE